MTDETTNYTTADGLQPQSAQLPLAGQEPTALLPTQGQQLAAADLNQPAAAESPTATVTLVNRLPHARGEKVLVDGSYYQIDQDGVMADVSEKDARKLLLNRAVWSLYNPRDPVTQPRPRSVALVDDQGRLFHPDMSATRKQVSVRPLQADDSDAAAEVLHSRDHQASTPALNPLVPEDDTQPVLYKPIDSPDLAQKHAAELGAKHVDEAGFAANVPGVPVKGADDVQAEAAEDLKAEEGSDGELGSQDEGTPADEAGAGAGAINTDTRAGKRGRKGR